jgi:hypothetical protein
MKAEDSGAKFRSLRFAGVVLTVIAVVVLALWTLGALFRFSSVAGALGLALVAIGLYATAHRWIVWLPGILIFGVLNSLIGLMTHRSPTNPTVNVPTSTALFLLTYYLLGCIASYFAADFTTFDRFAWSSYVVLMFVPVALPSSESGVLTPIVASLYGVGMLLVVATLLCHRYLGTR